MAESTKKTTTKKAAPKKPVAKKAEPVKAEAVKAEPKAKNSTQTVVIAVLSTVIVCIIVVFGVLLAAGVIKFNGNNDRGLLAGDATGQSTSGTAEKRPSAATSGKIINNPNTKVAVKDSTPVIVKDLEFYLPDDFKLGGKNTDGAYTYNLVDDDGWAQVLVYAEKSNLTPEKYLMKISPYLDITDRNYVMNGTNWVVGENTNALAYATELDGMIYAVYYSVKLDSDETAEAMQMIPKTLYMKRIYSE